MVDVKMTAKSPLGQFTRITGKYTTMGTFVPTPDANQETITGDSSSIDLTIFNSKLYSRNKPVTLEMGNGIQDGQIKKMTFVYKGSETATVTVQCTSLPGTNSEIVFSEVGDQITLIWTGGNWSVLETLNVTDPRLQSPWVR